MYTDAVRPASLVMHRAAREPRGTREASSGGDEAAVRNNKCYRTCIGGPATARPAALRRRSLGSRGMALRGPGDHLVIGDRPHQGV